MNVVDFFNVDDRFEVLVVDQETNIKVYILLILSTFTDSTFWT